MSRRIFLDWVCLFVGVPLVVYGLAGWFIHRHDVPRYHVVIRGGDIVYQDYWTTNRPASVSAPKPWFEYLPGR